MSKLTNVDRFWDFDCGTDFGTVSATELVVFDQSATRPKNGRF